MPPVPGGRGGPLDGVRILDFTRFQNGPACTQLLADYGAEVVKVEELVKGDRQGSPPENFNGYFEFLNRGKKSIEIDLKAPQSRAVLERLVSWADVAVENFKVGVMERLGLGYEWMASVNPRIIYAQNSGFGPKGPWSERGSYDFMAQAMAGVAVEQGGGPSHQPRMLQWGFSDQVGALNFAADILAAIVARHRTGRGQKIETSQLGATNHFQGSVNISAFKFGRQADGGYPIGYHIQQRSMTYLQAQDGKWLTVAIVQPHMYKGFCEAIGRTDLITDPKWVDGRMRWRNRDEVRTVLEAEIRKRPRDEWLRRFVEKQVPCAPVLTYAEVRDEPQFRENGYIVDVDHPIHGKIPEPGLAARFSDTPAPLPLRAPFLGEDTDAVLRGVGFSQAEADRLRRDGVTGKTPAPPGARL